MFTPTTPYVHSLGNGLILKSIGSIEDVERVTAFNTLIHGEESGTVARAMILHHPHTRPEHWIYVEDEATRQIVSSICLIPWRWRYGGVELRSGEMGFCGTLPEYRNRGLVRTLMNRHKEMLREGEYDLSHIQGIPYFYRQFEYEYALPLIGGWEIQPYQIHTESPTGYTRRLATVDDIPTLMRLKAEAAKNLEISADRDADEWCYMFEHTQGTGTAIDVWVLTDEAGKVVGYWLVEHFGFGEGLNVSEVSSLDHGMARATLHHLKELAEERKKPYVKLSVHEKCALIQTAAGMGAVDKGRYAWQIHIPTVPRLLRKIAPVLEGRLAESMYAGLTETLQLNLFKEAFALRFEGGKLTAVDSLGYVEGGEVRIPPLLFAPLVLGWRTRAELAHIYPDFSVWGNSQPLIDVLFPKMEAHIYTIY